MEEKQRMIQEYVPGKQVTLAHIIASPNKEIYTKLGLPEGTSNALGILTITPSEAAIIAVDIAPPAMASFLDISRSNGRLHRQFRSNRR